MPVFTRCIHFTYSASPSRFATQCVALSITIIAPSSMNIRQKSIQPEIHRSKKCWALLGRNYPLIPDIAPLALSVPDMFPLGIDIFPVIFCAITTCSIVTVVPTSRPPTAAASTIANVMSFLFEVTISTISVYSIINEYRNNYN